MAAKPEQETRTPEFVEHPAVAHVRAMVRNLKARTGRSLEEWLELLASSGAATRKERAAWLRREHAQSRVTSELIASFAEEGGGADGPAIVGRSDDAGAHIERQYAGKKAALRPIYEAVLEAAGALGADVTATPCATFVPLRRRYVFAQIRPSTQTRVDLGLALGKATDPLPPRLVPTGGKEKGDRITHRIELRSPAELDDEARAWLRRAYELDR